MERCPLCEGIATVGPDRPCYFCSLAFVESAPGRLAAIVPAHVLLDRPELAQGKEVAERLEPRANSILIDLSETLFLSSDSLCALVMLNNAAAQRGMSLTLAGARPHLIRLLQIFRLGDSFRLAQTVQDGLRSL
jgi:anti-anti-sigma factor